MRSRIHLYHQTDITAAATRFGGENPWVSLTIGSGSDDQLDIFCSTVQARDIAEAILNALRVDDVIDVTPGGIVLDEDALRIRRSMIDSEGARQALGWPVES